MKHISRSAIVGHSAPRMFALVDDIESYPRFLPWCVGARVEERTPERVRATLAIGLKGLRASMTTENTNRPGEAIALTLVHGPFRRFAAAWRFKALGEDACRVEFALDYELAGPLARVLAPLFDRIADTMMEAFIRRADELHGN